MGWFTRSKEERGTRDLHSGEAKPLEPAPAAGPAEPGTTPNPQRKVPHELADFFLVMEEHLTELELEDVQAIVDKLGQPPPILERVTRGLDDPEELTEAVTSNPALSADILRTVNSAAFALLTPISSIQHAITYLGASLVKGLVLQSTVTRVMAFEHASQEAAYMRLWRSSYIASTAALALAQNLRMRDAPVLSTQALLANLGDLALLSARPDIAGIYAAGTTLFSRAKAQQEDMIANAAIVAGILARQWGLPEDLAQGLRHSYVPMAQPPEDHPDTGEALRGAVVCYIAGRIGDQVAFHGLRDLGDFELLAQDALEYFYLPAYLEAGDLGKVEAALQDASVRKRINLLCTNLGKA